MKGTRLEAKRLFDNPPIAERLEQRCLDALRYYDEEREGWTTEMCWVKAGISKTTFYKALNARAGGGTDAPRGSGRKPYLSEQGFANLEAEVTRRSLRLDAPESSVQLTELILDEMRREAGNEFLEVQFSNSFLKKVRKRFITVNCADKKAPHRVKAFEQLRNPLSLCAVLQSLLRRGQSTELIYSSDDVSVLLNKMGEKPKVITTKRAKEILEAQNIGVSNASPDAKQRVVTYNITISGHGSLVCQVVKFADRTFNAFADKPFVSCIEDASTEAPLYFMLYKYGMEDAVVEEAMYRKCIIPEVLRHRASVQERDRRGLLEVVSSQSTKQGSQLPTGASEAWRASSSSANGGRDIDPSGGAPEEAEDEDGVDSEEEDFDVDPALMDPALNDIPSSEELVGFAALFCDGAFGQVTALMGDIAARVEKKNYKIKLSKYAGGCSMAQSANDGGKMHQIVHKEVTSPSFRYMDCPDRQGQPWSQLRDLLRESMEPASFKTVWKCFQHTPEILSKAFQPMNVQSAYRKCGVVPFVPARILSKCPHFRDLTTQQARSVLLSVDSFADEVDEHGCVPETAFQQMLAAAVDNTPIKTKGKPLNDMIVGRQRAVVMNHPDFQEHHARLESTKAQKRARASGTTAGPSAAAETDGAVAVPAEDGGDRAPKRKKRAVTCSNPACGAVMKESDRFDDQVVENSSSAEPWSRCGRSKCTLRFCGQDSCQLQLYAHRTICTKPAGRGAGRGAGKK